MKNLFKAVLLMGLLLAAGCASDPARRPTETPEWQYRTFPISAIGEGDFRNQLNLLSRQGWTFVNVATTTRNAQGVLTMVVMKRPNP